MTKVSSHQTLCTWDDKFGALFAQVFFFLLLNDRLQLNVEKYHIVIKYLT